MKYKIFKINYGILDPVCWPGTEKLNFIAPSLAERQRSLHNLLNSPKLLSSLSSKLKFIRRATQARGNEPCSCNFIAPSAISWKTEIP